MGQKPTKLTKTWADSPFSLIETPPHRTGQTYPRWGATAFATEMAIVHNHIIRILNAIYLQAPNVTQPQDIKDFATFMHSWLLLVHEHHGNEEEFFFPWMEEYVGIPNYMHQNVEQHHAFAPGMKEFDDYVKGVRDGTIVYDGARVTAIIDGFGETLTQHLTEEVAFLEKMEELGTKVNWQELNKRVTAHAVAHADTEFVIPIMVTNGDKMWEKGIHDAYWPPFPWYAALIFKYVYVPKHKGAWRFSCSDSNSMPKDLPFVKEMK